jgi:hypothetical protein
MKDLGFHADGTKDRRGRKGIAEMVVIAPNGDKVHLAFNETEWNVFALMMAQLMGVMVKLEEKGVI